MVLSVVAIVIRVRVNKFNEVIFTCSTNEENRKCAYFFNKNEVKNQEDFNRFMEKYKLFFTLKKPPM